MLASAYGLAQEGGVEAALERGKSSASVRELQSQAAAEPPKVDDRHELSVFFHRRGMARHRLGNYAGAAADLALALEHNQPNRLTPDGWGGRWRIQNDLLNSHSSRGDRPAQIDLLRKLAEEYRNTNLFSYHFVQLRLMDVHSLLGQWGEAERAGAEAEETLPRLRRLRQWDPQGFNALNKHEQYNAYLLNRQGHHAQAERRFRASLDWAEKYLDARRRTLPEGHQTVRIARGNLAEAKKDLAGNLASQGKYAEAEAFARAGLEDSLQVYGFTTTAVSYAVAVLGWTRFQQGDISGAERYYRHALAAALGSGMLPHATQLAGRRAALGNALLVQRRWDEANKVFEERDRGLRSDAEQFRRFRSGHVSWAYALYKSGQVARAVAMSEGLVASWLKRPVPGRWNLAWRRGVLAMALAGSGKTAEALRGYREAIPDLVRQDHDDGGDEDVGFWRAFWQREILEGYLELLARLHASGTAPADLDVADEAFRIADVARGSSVQGAITSTAARAQLPDQGLTELARKDHDTLNQIAALHRVLARLAEAPEEKRPHKVIADMQVDIVRLRKQRAELRGEILQRYPEYANLVDPRPVGIAEAGRQLLPGEALVSIYLGEAQAYVWTLVHGAKAAFRVVPLKRTQVDEDVQALRRAADFGDGTLALLRPFEIARARRLYGALLEPDAALWNDARLLHVVPHGALSQLPFALLATGEAPQPAAGPQDAYREVPWLARRVAIAQLPSASAFAALRRSPAAGGAREAFIGFGDPLFGEDRPAGAQAASVRNLSIRKAADATEERIQASRRGGENLSAKTASAPQSFSLLGALPDTADELKEIAALLKADASRDLFLNRQATEKNVKQATLATRRVVAFATHGLVPGEISGLDQPALALANPAMTGDADNDGFLTMEEVLGLKLSADWVILSACNTAAADGRASEAVSGLGRAFFYAGARSLLVSNWAVETVSARLITTGIFRRQAQDAGLTRAEALRQSMLALIADRAPAAEGGKPGGYSYAHPAFWAPFSLVGDGGRN